MRLLKRAVRAVARAAGWLFDNTWFLAGWCLFWGTWDLLVLDTAWRWIASLWMYGLAVASFLLGRWQQRQRRRFAAAVAKFEKIREDFMVTMVAAGVPIEAARRVDQLLGEGRDPEALSILQEHLEKR